MPADGERIPSGSATEEWAAALLLSHLVAAGEVVTLLGPPKAADGRSPDFELDVDGRLVALEVTQLWRSAYQMSLAQQIQDQVRLLVGEEPPGRAGGGFILIYVHVCAGARSRSIAKVAAAIVERLIRFETDEAEFEVEHVRVHMSRRGALTASYGFVLGSQSAGGYTAAMAAEFVATLIDRKGTQAAAYNEAWIVVIENMLIVDAEEIADALHARSADIPNNWARMFVLPASNRVPVEIMFRGRVSAGRSPAI